MTLKYSHQFIISLFLICFIVIDDAKTSRDAMAYFHKYGYFTKLCTGCEMTEDIEVQMIKNFQDFANLEQTGKIDEATIKQMELPRCAKADTKYDGFKNTRRRVKRYNPQGTTWKKNKLTWRYNPKMETKDLSRDTVICTLKKALCLWSSKTNIEFVEDNINEADILISFGTRNHGDAFHFDGSGGILAHAFYPGVNRGLNGDVHFDDDETFTIGSSQGRNLLWVATHELGHSLGLGHSNVKEAVMYPWYTGYQSNLDLRYDDKFGIQTIYGGKVGGEKECKNVCKNIDTLPTTISPVTTAESITPTTTASNCPSKITAIWDIPRHGWKGISTEENEVFILKANGEIRSGPTSPRDLSINLSGPIDAAFTINTNYGSNGNYTLFFSGEQYTIYKNSFEYVSGPHSIKKVYEGGKKTPLEVSFPSYVKKIDAAIWWQRGRTEKRRIYFFFKKNGYGYFSRYNPYNKKFTRGYPKRTSKLWRDIPQQGPDAAFSSKKDGTYFIIRNQLYNFNDRKVRVEEGYPKEIGSEFIKCDDIETAPIREYTDE